MSAPQAETALVGATLVDGTGAPPRANAAVIVSDGRIAWVGDAGELPPSPDREVADVSGKYLIPGMLDANVHLLMHVDPDVVMQFEPGAYDELILEAAQVALREGITTVFDTWGPLESLRRVRDQIDGGDAVGSRIFFAGNIIGNGGPYSVDFHPAFEADLTPSVLDAVNAHWEQGVGGDLPWMSAEDARLAVRTYIETSGIDFVKYAGSAHAHGQFLAFSPNAQEVIVDEAHAVGMTAQACTQSVEALRTAIDCGVDLLQHGDVTGLRPMPEQTLEEIVARQLPCVAFLQTERHLRAVRDAGLRWHSIPWGDVMVIKDANDRRLIESGAKLLLAHDMGIYGPSVKTSLRMISTQITLPDTPHVLGESHIYWLQAAVERGMSAMDALTATTRNIAEAYRKTDEIGTIEPTKRADIVVLDADPLADPANYGRVARVMKDGLFVDRDSLPERPVLTARVV